MTEEVKSEVIKKTQDVLKKHIKKPPLTEKLLKKPPFRFLHDIVTSVIKDTGFLNGLFTAEELNHENIKDRDGKIAFLDKLISAVKIITGIPLSVRATKIVAGHEPGKTNELLQAIGLALDKKLDSKDVAQQLRKKGSKKEDSDSKKSSPRESKQKKDDGGQTRVQEGIPKQQEETQEKKKKASSTTRKQEKEPATQEVSAEKKKRSSSISKHSKSKETTKTSKSKTDSTHSDPKSVTLLESEHVGSENKGQVAIPSTSKQDLVESQIPEPNQKRPQSSLGQRRPSAVRQQSDDQPPIDQPKPSMAGDLTSADSQDSPRDQEASLTLPPLSSESPTKSVAAESKAQAPTKPPQAPAPVPLVRPRTAARVGSARPGAPRVRNRGEAVVVSEEVPKPAPVNLIVEDDSTKISNEDEDENLVTVETALVEDVPENRQSSTSRPTSQQGHLVAQILETQKALEVGTTFNENGEPPLHHTEIEWEAGKKRERETAAKEVDRMRSLIQTLTRAAHPLGKLLDSLQEDVDNMQRELTQWQNMQTSLEQQLQMEETLCMQASQPLKEQLKQLQQAVRLQLDQISSAKANIISNDERIRRLLTGSQS